jgi:hypothetical protein
VIVEPAPLVEGDNQHGVVQVSGAGQGVISVGDEPFAEPDVGQRVVIGRCAIALGIEGGIDEADVRQVPLRHRVDERRGGNRDPDSVGVPVREGMPEREILRAPQRQEGQVTEEVPAGRDALVVGDGRQLVPDGRQRGDRKRVMVPVGPGRVLVEAVREGLAGKRAEIAIQDRVMLG